MTGLASPVTLFVVSYRAKLALLSVVIAAILYVLISPLPELAATSASGLPVFTLILLVLLLAVPPSLSRLAGCSRAVTFLERDTLLAQECVRLC